MRGTNVRGHTFLNRKRVSKVKECPLSEVKEHISLNKRQGNEAEKCPQSEVRGHTSLNKKQDSVVEECPLLIGGGHKGSVTTEAAIAMPVFLCVIISIIFFIRIVYTHEIIQHAITEAANEMASVSYIYHVTGLRDIHDTVRDGIDDKSRMFDEHVSNLFDGYKSISDLGELIDTAGEAASDPLGMLKAAVIKITEEEFDDIKTEICIPLVKLYMRKYLASGIDGDVDGRLRGLNIAGGFEGLDFSRSEFFEDEENNIEIVVEYRINLPVPLKILPEIIMQQRAVVKAWMDGDGSYKRYAGEEGNTGGNDGTNEDSGTDEDIWSLSNFTRGRRIRAIFGANMPASFPVIARFESGKATMIKSMDLTANTYRSVKAVEDKVNEYIDKLKEFKGQEEPWGSKKIVIREADILSKELLLVIPKNPVAPEIRDALERCKARAMAYGIYLGIEEYGYKKLEQ